MPDPMRWFFPIERLRALTKDMPGEWLISLSPTNEFVLAVLESGGIRHIGVIDLHDNVVRYFRTDVLPIGEPL